MTQTNKKHLLESTSSFENSTLNSSKETFEQFPAIQTQWKYLTIIRNVTLMTKLH